VVSVRLRLGVIFRLGLGSGEGWIGVGLEGKLHLGPSDGVTVRFRLGLGLWSGLS